MSTSPYTVDPAVERHAAGLRHVVEALASPDPALRLDQLATEGTIDREMESLAQDMVLPAFATTARLEMSEAEAGTVLHVLVQALPAIYDEAIGSARRLPGSLEMHWIREYGEALTAVARAMAHAADAAERRERLAWRERQTAATAGPEGREA